MLKMGIRYVKFTFFAKHTIVFLIFPGLIETLPAFVGMFFQESPAKKAGAYLIFVIVFTRTKFLKYKIYTEKRQFFAVNL